MQAQKWDEILTSLRPMFDPSSVAIIGASSNPNKPSGQPLVALLKNGYKGQIYPVNPRYTAVQGIPCYPSVTEIPGTVDLAIIAVPARQVLDQMRACAEKKVPAVIIFTSGFAETGGEGARMQRKLTDLARQHGIRVCGPNCMGIFGARNSLMANFSIDTLPDRVIVQDFLGFISQSGGFGSAVYEIIRDRGIGFSYFISTGNEADVDFSEYIAFLVEDEHTRVIGGYLEGVKDGAKFIEAVDMANRAGKPVLLIKTGRHEAAARAAASHTGSLVGSDKVYQALFRQKGILRMESIEEMKVALSVLASGKLPAGNRVCIVATSGGSGVMMADKCAEYGLELAELSEETRRKLSLVLPEFASTSNPVDITGQVVANPLLLKEALEIILGDPNYDIMILCYWALHGRNELYLNQLAEMCLRSNKVIMNLIWGPEQPAIEAVNSLNDMLVPAAREADFAVRALSSLAWYVKRQQELRQPSPEVPIPAGAREKVQDLLSGLEPGSSLGEYRTKQILRCYGIPCTGEILVQDEAQAVQAAAELGYPVALKIESPDILHKTEAGGVKLNLTSADDVRRAFREVISSARQYRPSARLSGVLVQQMLPPGTELIAGIGQDPVFGSTVLCGLGGIFVEALRDVSIRLLPLTFNEALAMIDELKAQRVLNGIRGNHPVDRHQLAQILVRLAALASDFPSIAELDINPLIATPRGIVAADGLLVLRK